MGDSSVIQIFPPSPAPNSKDPSHATPPPTAAVPDIQNNPMILDRTLSSAANLVKLLPTGTVLAFQALSPSFDNRGMCYASNKYLMLTLILCCSFTCVFFAFTDSLVGADGKLYYGIATLKGFFVINYSGDDKDRNKVFTTDLSRLKVRCLDWVHAFFTVLVFLTVAFSDSETQTCFFPNAGPNSKELLLNLPLGAGFLSSVVFLVFPSYRKGIGSDMTPHKQA